MSVTIGGVVFDRVSYDREADVMYLHVGDPRRAVEFDESAEGHALRYDAHGHLVGVTIVNARRLLDLEGRVTLTGPELPWHVEADDLAEALQVAR
jgi:YD repeat-containing protein